LHPTLSEEQEENHVSKCQDLQGGPERDPEFLSKIIAGDETWVYTYNPETKQKTSHWKSPPSPYPLPPTKANLFK
jgi:hypothetical protein